MSRTTQRRSSVRPPWGTWGGVCQKSPAFTGCSTPSWIRIHSPSRHTPHCSFGCECTGDTERGSSVTTDSIALTPGKIRAEMPGASCRTMPPSRRLWNIRSPFVSVYSRDLNPYSNSRSQGGPVRFFVAMFSHETNTFSTIPTDRRQFEARDLRYGGELLEAYRGTGTCLGGMIEAAGARGVTLVPSLAAAASPAGRVTADFYEATTRRPLDDLRRPADRSGPDAAALRPRGRDGARPAGRDDLDLRRLPARRHPRRGPVGLRRDRRRPGPRRPARRRAHRHRLGAPPRVPPHRPARPRGGRARPRRGRATGRPRRHRRQHGRRGRRRHDRDPRRAPARRGAPGHRTLGLGRGRGRRVPALRRPR